MGRFIKDWVPGSAPDGGDPPRVTRGAWIAIGVLFLLVAVALGIYYG
ncbi:MAG: hypothetical protein WAP35_03045 [Solirubrobacterales bacterium]